MQKVTKNIKNNPLIIFTAKNLETKKALELVSKGIKVFKVKSLIMDFYVLIVLLNNYIL